MYWGEYPRRRGRTHNGFFVVGMIIFLIAVSSAHSFTPFIPIFLLLFLVLPAVRRSQANREQDYEKPKNDFEKPKRSERYVESDDGTLLEVIDEQPYEDDHTDYV